MKDWKLAHRQWMFMILQTIYSSKYGKNLGFTGGTALYFFYNLPRFSVDLDFELIDTDPESIKSGLFTLLKKKIQAKGGTIKQDGTLKSNFRFIVQYGGNKKLKIECNNNKYDNIYEQKNLFGTTINVMDVRRMFSHKLCAFISRYKQKEYIANRDLFDMNFLFQKQIQPEEEIIKYRSEKLTSIPHSTKEWYSYLHGFITKHQDVIQKNILNGLGELIEQRDKAILKHSLLNELLQQLALASMK